MHDEGHAADAGHDGGMVMIYGTGAFNGHDADRDDGRDYGDGERRNMFILIVNMMGMLMVMVLVDGTCAYKCDDSDHDYGRDTGDGELLILVSMRDNTMVMQVVIIILMTVAISMIKHIVKCW